MGKFVLVLILMTPDGFAPVSHTIATVEGFSSTATCSAAGERWTAKMGVQRSKYLCLEVK